MTGAILVPVSQVLWQVLAWPLVALLVAAGLRRQVALLPALAVVALLVYGALSTLGVGYDPSGATWFAAAPLLLATYPDGRPVPRWFAVPVAASLAVAAAVVVTAGAVTDAVWFAPWVGIGQLLLALGQVHRYRRRASTDEREAVRWALLGVIVCIEAYVLLALVEGGTVGGSGAWSVGAANLALAPAAVGPAIGLLAPRLWPVDPLLRMLIGVTVAAPLLAAGYATGAAVGVAAGAASDVAGWWGAVVLAALAVPVTRVAGRVSAWLVYRGRADPAAAVVELGRRLDAQPDARQVPVMVLAVVVDALRLDAAALRGHGLLAVEHGDVGDGEHACHPIVHLGEELGVLVVPPRRGETTLTARDLQVVRVLAVHAAPALHGARALADLADAHTATLLAREEERRRLRRDLHDDLSPSLAGLRLGAAALSRRAHADPALARLAQDLQDGIAATAKQAREIAYGLRPPVLDDQGLVAAITARVHGQSADDLQIRVDAPPGRLELPAAVDLAALRIVQEAVSNVRRHAAATTCVISLERDEGDLVVSITDDGRGLPARITPGLGLSSIRERATELAGSVRIDRLTPGTRVVVRLPTGAT